MSTVTDHDTRISALEAAAFRTGHDLAEIKQTQGEHTARLDELKAGQAATDAKLDEAIRISDVRHTAVTSMLQELLDRLPPRP